MKDFSKLTNYELRPKNLWYQLASFYIWCLWLIFLRPRRVGKAHSTHPKSGGVEKDLVTDYEIRPEHLCATSISFFPCLIGTVLFLSTYLINIFQICNNVSLFIPDTDYL